MSSLFEAQSVPTHFTHRAAAEALLTTYLDSLCAPLVGIIPSRERLRLREETAFHLDRLINAFLVEGMTPVQATQHAIAKYGPAPEVARHFLDAWYAYYPSGRLTRRIGLGFVTAMIWFGAVTLLVTLLAQYRLFRPDMSPMEPFGIAATVRHILPPAFASIEVNGLFFALWGIALVAPIVAGWATGRTVLVRPARAVGQAQALLTLYTFTLGVHLLPAPEGVALALFQLLYWLPAGCLCAFLAAQVALRRRCRILLDEEANDEA